MRVLFLLLTGPNSSNLYTDLVKEFAAQGHEVWLVCPSYKRTSKQFEVVDNVNRVWVDTLPIFQVHPILKGIATLTIPFKLKKAIKKFIPDKSFDLVLTPTPPITFVDIVAWLKRISNVKSYLILRDIFPQNARDLEMMKSKILFNYFRRKEKKLYRYSDYIGCMSQGNIDYVLQHNPEVPVSKMHLLPNWQKAEFFAQRDESVKEKYGIKDKFVAIFGGNLGEPQHLDNIILLANLYRNDPDVVFLVVGKGTKKKYLEEQILEHKLENIILKDFIPRTDYRQIVVNADIGLISLSEKFTIPNIPSKTLAYFNAGIPIFAIIDKQTDYGSILDEAKAGFWCHNDDVNNVKMLFDKLYQDKALRLEMGKNGQEYFLKNLTDKNAYQSIMEQIKTN